jgi:hypothetical protein
MRRRWKDNIKIDLREIDHEDEILMEVVQIVFSGYF